VRVHGLLLAAGAGSRMGMPKALVSDEAGPWLPRGVSTLLAGGCQAVTVVLGAAVDDALPLLLATQAPAPLVRTVVAHDWAEGMGASLRTGLLALADTDADAALVHLVDLPDVGSDVVRRVVSIDTTTAGRGTTTAVRAATAAADALARASYDGVPGHPVLLGRDHWAPIAASVSGDQGARDYLRTHDTCLVECGDLATGTDVDHR
jgi:CTP:molybdopterin cytidylyltransferase MocA